VPLLAEAEYFQRLDLIDGYVDVVAAAEDEKCGGGGDAGRVA